jgi:hypothetical protein
MSAGGAEAARAIPPPPVALTKEAEVLKKIFTKKKVESFSH